MTTRTPFQEVPPAVTPSNVPQARIQATRSRQATFERGVALALVSSMLDSLERLGKLKEGLRWLLQDEDVRDISRWMEALHSDIERAERIEERRDRE